MELGLNPGWIDSQQIYGANQNLMLAPSGIQGELLPEFSNLLEQFDPSVYQLMNPEDQYKGQKSSEVATPVMDSKESDEVDVVPALAIESPLLSEIQSPRYLKSDHETYKVTDRVLEDLDRLRLKFFMQEEPTFRGLAEQKIGEYSDLMRSTVGSPSSDQVKGFQPVDLHTGPLIEDGAIRPKTLDVLVEDSILSPVPSLETTQMLKPRNLTEPQNSISQEVASLLHQYETDPEPSLEAVGSDASYENLGLQESISKTGASQSKDSDENKKREESFKAEKAEVKLEKLSSSFETQLGGLGGGSRHVNPISGGDKQVLDSLVTQNQERIDRAANLLLESGGGSARIKLSPEGMGEIELRIHVHGENVNVQFIADNLETKELFEKSIQQLKSQLEAQSLKVDSLNVQVAEARSSSSADAGRDQSQPNPNLGLLRDMMNQSRQEAFDRQSNTIADWESIRTFGRTPVPPDPIASVLEANASRVKRYQGDSRGKRLSVVG